MIGKSFMYSNDFFFQASYLTDFSYFSVKKRNFKNCRTVGTGQK